MPGVVVVVVMMVVVVVVVEVVGGPSLPDQWFTWSPTCHSTQSGSVFFLVVKTQKM